MNKPPLLYFFPHIYLRDVVLKQWSGFRDMAMQGPVALKAKLVESFNKLKEDSRDMLVKKDVVLDPMSFDSTVATLSVDKKLMIIKFPTPQETTEVTFVGVLLGEAPRYFTFELHRPEEAERKLSPDRVNDSYKLCEWKNDGKHLLLSSTDQSTSEIFVNEIKKII